MDGYTIEISNGMMRINLDGKIRNIPWNGSLPHPSELIQLAEFIAMVEDGAYERGREKGYDDYLDARNERGY